MLSPFQAILDYERSLDVPPGWINQSISASGRDGSWSRLERGEILLDRRFFDQFKADLSDETRWRTFYAKHLAKTRQEKQSDAAEEAAHSAPGVPDIDPEKLFWMMMSISRTPDPHMYPALKLLRQAADASNGKLILGALSNTSIFPHGHAYNDPSTPDGKRLAELRGLFDVFVSSAHVGMRKPDEDIYHYAIKQLDDVARRKGASSGLAADDIVFLDDIGTNLRTAKKIGMHTIKVQLGRADLAVAELEQITGISLVPATARL